LRREAGLATLRPRQKHASARRDVVLSAPWYLLAAGIALVVIGALLTALTGSSGRKGGIHSRMRDEDIARELEREQRLPVGSLVILAGLVCVVVSIGWRIAQAVL
jgi:type VI protein secretion system component VasF